MASGAQRVVAPLYYTDDTKGHTVDEIDPVFPKISSYHDSQVLVYKVTQDLYHPQ